MAESEKGDFLVFGTPDIQEDEIGEVEATLRSGWIGTGPRVAQFEEAFAGYKDVPPSRVAAVNSCTAALHVSMIAAGLGPGDEVLTTAMTFCATANAIIHAGATPVPVDIEPRSMNIDPRLIEENITSRTKAIVLVHFAGRPCDMDVIQSLAQKHGLIIIEDCAHAIETEWKGRKAGTFGDFGCFSFYVTKNVVTGEGGMVLAKDPNHIDRIRILALHGMTKDAWRRFADEGYKHYQVVEAGFKYNMMDIQAALGIHQLRRVEENRQHREAIWRRYQEAFADLPVETPADPDPEMRHAFHLYTVLVDDERCGMSRDAFLSAMTRSGIGVGIHYQCLARHPYYQQAYGWRPEDYPVADRCGAQTVSLPLGPRLSDAAVQRVIDTVQGILEA